MEDFIRNLLQEAGIPPELSDDVRDELIRNMVQEATDLLNKRMIEALPPEGLAEFQKLTEDPATTPEQFQEVITKHVSDVQQVTTNALQEFRSLYLGNRQAG